MRLLGKKLSSNGKNYIVDVAFDDMFHIDVWPELFLACLIANVPSVDVVSFLGQEVVREKNAIRDVLEIKDNKEQFGALFGDPFLLDAFFKVYKLNAWTMDFSYNRVPVHVFQFIMPGEAHGDEIRFTIPKEFELPEENSSIVLKLCYEAETASYAYHNFNKQLISVFTDRNKFTLKRAVQQMQKFSRHKDVGEEYFNCLKEDGFAFSFAGAISVEGHTAEELHRNYQLSELGAYNYLIYLREKPGEALQKLAAGLPRR